MIDSRRTLELCSTDGQDRVYLVARASREQACEITIPAGSLAEHRLRQIQLACPDSRVLLSLDGMVWRVMVIPSSSSYVEARRAQTAAPRRARRWIDAFGRWSK